MASAGAITAQIPPQLRESRTSVITVEISPCPKEALFNYL